MVNEEKKEAIEKLRQELKEIQEDEALSKEEKALREQIATAKFRQAHPKLLGFSKAWSGGFKRIFKGIGTGIKKAGIALEKSDRYIAEQKAKERELNKSKPKKSSIKDELDFLD